MDAVQYLKLKGKMTLNCQTDCRICRLSRYNNSLNKPCRIFETQKADEAVEIVEKWAEEHPVKTRMDKFLEEYPNANVERNRRTKAFLRICPISIDTTKRETHNCSQYDTCNDCLSEYWNEEVEE